MGKNLGLHSSRIVAGPQGRFRARLATLQLREGLLITSSFSMLNPNVFWTLSATASLLNLIIGSGRPKPQHFPKFYKGPLARALSEHFKSEILTLIQCFDE
jgi:hypothetical protein